MAALEQTLVRLLIQSEAPETFLQTFIDIFLSLVIVMIPGGRAAETEACLPGCDSRGSCELFV